MTDVCMQKRGQKRDAHATAWLLSIMRNWIAVFAVLLLWMGAAAARAQGVDHSPFEQILKAHLHDGMVDYRAIAEKDGAALDAYLGTLARTDPAALERDERLALYLNLYNATMIDAVLDRYREGFSVSENEFAIFKLPLVRVGGRTMTLDHLENKIIRPEFTEPRSHAALVCAARSCPPLRAEAYTGEKLEKQLDDQMRKWLGNSQLNQISEGDGPLRVSEIFKWYAEDFGGTEKIATYIDAYHPVETTGRAVEFVPYDWALNDRKR